MKRASYRDAIDWMVFNDDTNWLTPDSILDGADIIPSVTASLVADIFGVTTEGVTADLRRRKRHFDRGRVGVRRDLAKGEHDDA
jgi:hypothetical protein